jgi:hypothetical protein
MHGLQFRLECQPMCRLQVQQLQEQYAGTLAGNAATGQKVREAVQELAAATGASAAVVEQLLKAAKQAGAGGRGKGPPPASPKAGGSPKPGAMLVATGLATGGLLSRAGKT